MSRTVGMRSRIFAMVLRRTMIRKEDGVSYDRFPGLSRTTPSPAWVTCRLYCKLRLGLIHVTSGVVIAWLETLFSGDRLNA